MSDYKLNKYLAKLKNAHDLKKANVYISKILKYKQMGGQKGGDPEKEISAASLKAAEINAKFEQIKELKLAVDGKRGDIIKSIEGIVTGEGKNVVGEDELRTGLTNIFTEVKGLIGKVNALSELNPDDLKINLDDILAAADAKKATGKPTEEIKLDGIVKETWDNAK